MKIHDSITRFIDSCMLSNSKHEVQTWFDSVHGDVVRSIKQKLDDVHVAKRKKPSDAYISELSMQCLLDKYLQSRYSSDVQTCKKKLFLDLGTMIASTTLVPDISIHMNGMPVYLLEVHSIPGIEGYKQTIKKTIANLIDLMRWHFCNCGGPQLQKLQGIVLPSTHPNYEVGFATLINVEFKLLHFHVQEFEKVEMCDLEMKLMKSVQENIDRILLSSPISTVGFNNFFLKLPVEFLDRHNLFEQFYSKHSIVVADYENVYKFVNNLHERTQVDSLCSQCSMQTLELEKSLIPHNWRFFEGIRFFTYERLPKSGCSRKEAIANFPELVSAVIAAIEELHACNIAHLDIRLDNIGFRRECDFTSAVLIDLDRSKPADESYQGDSIYKHSCMYTVPAQLISKQKCQVTNATMDWVQLGFMLIWILLVKDVSSEEDIEYHSMNSDHISKLKVDKTCKDFLQDFVIHGKY